MPGAILLLRERNVTSLTSIVEKALKRKPPLLEYDLKLTPTQLDFILSKNVTLLTSSTTTSSSSSSLSTSSTTTVSNVNNNNNNEQQHQDDNEDKLLKSNNLDEGFESDIDTISILSCDDHPQDLLVKKKEKLQETDSANGSACSDTDDNDTSTSTATMTMTTASKLTTKEQQRDDDDEEINRNESFDLVDCSCYTDVRAPEILLFVIKNETFVFKLNDYVRLQRFYANFSALKAVANQKLYNNGKNLRSKFNLLQRTDCNGVTHIEISTKEHDNQEIEERQQQQQHQQQQQQKQQQSSSSIISLNTPEDNCLFNNYKTLKTFSKNNGIVVWNSVEDLLMESTNSKPDRRKKKPKAPLPPTTTPLTNNNTSLQLSSSTSCFSPPSDNINAFANEFNTKLTTYQQFTTSTINDIPRMSMKQEPNPMTMTLNRKKLVLDSWTNSVPRLLKKQRSKSETRNFTPMAYRYIDTTQLLHNEQMKYAKEQAKTKAKEQAKQLKEQMKSYKQEQTNKEKEHFWQIKEQSKQQHQQVNYLQLPSMQRYQMDSMSGTLRKTKNYNSNNNNYNNEDVSNTISNRLFGMSSKLRDFSAIDTVTNQTNPKTSSNKKSLSSSGKWSSLGELSYKLNQSNYDGSLKSVIKKEDNKKRANNEKKVTFSAYTTVQVV